MGETPEHRELKQRVAIMLRELGCYAQIEATPSPGDYGGWRADVLGISPDGRRVAFEIQLAPMTIDEGAQRTARYDRDGIQCLWLTTRPAHWICGLPSGHLTRENGELVVDRGLGRRGTRESQDRWVPAGPVRLKKVVLGLLRGRITVGHQKDFVDSYADHATFVREATLLVSTSENELLNRARAQMEQRETRHAANRAALYQRQGRVLQAAIEDAALAVASGRIWLGVPPKPWDGSTPVARGLARGSDSTGGGAAIWAVETNGVPQLWAVACPVASKTTRSLANSWRRRRVRVYCETRWEAERLASALGWSVGDLVIREPKPQLASVS